jgi:hypothetical protein
LALDLAAAVEFLVASVCGVFDSSATLAPAAAVPFLPVDALPYLAAAGAFLSAGPLGTADSFFLGLLLGCSP